MAGWSTLKLLGYLAKLTFELVAYPEDGSIELELNETIEILRYRGVLV